MTDDWQPLLQHASQLRKAGRVGEAISAYLRLLEVKPDLADSWYNLGWLLKQDRQFEAAFEAYGQALARDVSGAEEVHLNRAVILADHLARPDDAERELRAALDRNPNYLPALLNLGNLREDLGDRAGARDAYQRMLAADPGNATALARLTGASHAPDLDEALAGQLRSALAGSASPAEKATLGFALAGLLDAAGRYEEAFEVARTANDSSRAAAGADYPRESIEAFIDTIFKTFDKPAIGDDAGPAIFICGMFRSGSTLVEQILGGHSRITRGGELDLIRSLVGQIYDYPVSVPSTEPSTVAAWRDFYRRGLPPQRAELLTDKRPDNFLHIGLIKTLFPKAKIVHTRRNPLDNLLSLYFLHLDPGMSYALDLADAAHWYGQHDRLMAHWKSLYPDDIFEVDYDALVREPRPVIEPLLGFLGLDWEDSVLDFHRADGPVKTASVWQVREPLNARSSGRWRNYEHQLAPVRQLIEQ